MENLDSSRISKYILTYDKSILLIDDLDRMIVILETDSNSFYIDSTVDFPLQLSEGKPIRISGKTNS